MKKLFTLFKNGVVEAEKPSGNAGKQFQLMTRQLLEKA